MYNIVHGTLKMGSYLKQCGDFHEDVSVSVSISEEFSLEVMHEVIDLVLFILIQPTEQLLKVNPNNQKIRLFVPFSAVF